MAYDPVRAIFYNFNCLNYFVHKTLGFFVQRSLLFFLNVSAQG